MVIKMDIHINPLQYKLMDYFSTLKVKNKSVQIAIVKLYFFPLSPWTFTFCPTPMHKIPQVEIYMDFQSHFCLIQFRTGVKDYFFQFPHTNAFDLTLLHLSQELLPLLSNPVPVNS